MSLRALADDFVELQVIGRVDDREVRLAASGSHDADVAVLEHFVQWSLALLKTIDPIEEDARFTSIEDPPAFDDALGFDAVAPALHAHDG